jgi:hypothetical protein
MTETTTFPLREGSTFSVTIEDDAAPIVRLVGQTLRRAALTGHVSEAVAEAVGSVAVRSHDTPQAATVRFSAEAVEVTGGVLVETDATVVVDLHARFTPTQEPEGDAGLAAVALGALRPPLPHWQEAAERFWELTRHIPGIPDVLLVEAAGPDGTERGRFGKGETEYLIAGPPDVLSGVFTGADDFLASLDAGVQIRGTLSDLSVMAAASWKVRFDV